MSARALGLLALVSVLWGLPYLLIKLAVDGGVSSAMLVWVRCLIGGLALQRWRCMAGCGLICAGAGARSFHWRCWT
jgi:drug/metabolite transporter (DMT)-like permease